MLVAESLCWRLFSLCWWFSNLNVLNWSSTSWIGHQNLKLNTNIRHQHQCNLVTVIRCWWQNHYVGNFLSVNNRSLTFKSCHQHKLSPTFITSINLTDSNYGNRIGERSDESLLSGRSTSVRTGRDFLWKNRPRELPRSYFSFCLKI